MQKHVYSYTKVNPRVPFVIPWKDNRDKKHLRCYSAKNKYFHRYYRVDGFEHQQKNGFGVWIHTYKHNILYLQHTM